MNEAPKKIWKVSGYWEFYSTNENENEISYIRADIADELVEALKYVMTAHGEQLSDAFEKAQAALKKLEEEQ